MTAAEMEEAVFGKIAWFDVEDDIADENKEDAIAYRDQLLEDFHLTGVADAVSKVFLLGAIYGTGIAKINVGRRPIWAIDEGQTKVEKRVMVDVEAIRPDEFVIDPSALTVEDAEFVAHEIVKPSHVIAAKIKAKQYRDAPLRPYSGIKGDPYGTGRWDKADSLDNGVLITEYYGKVPSKFLKGGSGDTLVEALVTLVNESYVLKAVKSPFTNKDRPVIAYQHDTVPGEFWGRGVAEKGYNPQKALDSELRARIDAYALMNAPMLGADITRLPRNPDMRVRPGKIFMTRGRPSEIIEPVAYNANLAATFQQSGDLERMVQMGTGAMDSATPNNISRRNETAGGMSMMQAGFVKRSKRTMQNLERQFMNPLIRKALWRYMQFDPQRYPKDAKFLVHSSMGIMAKEVEGQQLTQMLGFVPPESPAHSILLKAIFDNTNSSEKGDIKKAVDAMLKPPSEEEQAMQQEQQKMQMEAQKQELRSLTLKNDKLESEIALNRAKTEEVIVDTELADDLVDIQAANAATAAQKARVADRQVAASLKINANKSKGD